MWFPWYTMVHGTQLYTTISWGPDWFTKLDIYDNYLWPFQESSFIFLYMWDHVHDGHVMWLPKNCFERVKIAKHRFKKLSKLSEHMYEKIQWTRFKKVILPQTAIRQVKSPIKTQLIWCMNSHTSSRTTKVLNCWLKAVPCLPRLRRCSSNSISFSQNLSTSWVSHSLCTQDISTTTAQWILQQVAIVETIR